MLKVTSRDIDRAQNLKMAESSTTTACQGDISYLLDDDFDDILKQLEKYEILDIELEDISTNVSTLKLSALNIREKTTTKVKPAIVILSPLLFSLFS